MRVPAELRYETAGEGDFRGGWRPALTARRQMHNAARRAWLCGNATPAALSLEDISAMLCRWVVLVTPGAARGAGWSYLTPSYDPEIDSPYGSGLVDWVL